MKRLDAAKLERLGRLVCGPLWQSEQARTMGVSRQTILRWRRGSSTPRLNNCQGQKGGPRADRGVAAPTQSAVKEERRMEIDPHVAPPPLGVTHSYIRVGSLVGAVARRVHVSGTGGAGPASSGSV